MEGRNDNPAEALPSFDYRGLYRKSVLPPCLLEVEDLRKLAAKLKERAREVLNEYLESLKKPADQSQEDFDAEKARVSKIEPLLVYVIGDAGEQVVGSPEDALSDARLPDRIKSIGFDTATALKQYGVNVPNRLQVVLDLAPPPVFYGYQPWDSPTPNESRVEVAGPNTAWGAAVHEEALDFFRHRRTRRGWLHSPTTFNLLHWLVAWPASLWLAFAGDDLGTTMVGDLPAVWRAVLIIYLTLVGLILFRVAIGALRWVFPVVEKKGTRPLKVRAAVLAVVGSPFVGPIIWLVERVW